MLDNFKNAERYIKKISDDKIRKYIIKIAYDTEDKKVYFFTIYMYNQSSKLFWLEIAVDILINVFNFMEEAYVLALDCVEKMIKKQRTVKNLEMLLFFYDIPDNLISSDVAMNISDEILQIDSNNRIALQTKNRLLCK